MTESIDGHLFCLYMEIRRNPGRKISEDEKKAHAAAVSLKRKKKKIFLSRRRELFCGFLDFFLTYAQIRHAAI